MTDAWAYAEQRAKEAAGGKYVKLTDDGHKVIGFFCGEPHVAETHFNEVTNKTEAFTPAHLARGLKPKPKFTINLFVLDEMKMKILNMGPGTFGDMLKVKGKYGLDIAYEIERRGKKGDTKTTYTVLPDIPKDKLTAEQKAAFAAAVLHNLAEDTGDDDSTDMNSADKAKTNGAAGAGSAAPAIVSAEESAALTTRLKPMPRANIDAFLAKFDVKQVKLLPKARLAEATAFVTSMEPQAAPAAAAEVDPFALAVAHDHDGRGRRALSRSLPRRHVRRGRLSGKSVV